MSTHQFQYAYKQLPSFCKSDMEASIYSFLRTASLPPASLVVTVSDDHLHPSAFIQDEKILPPWRPARKDSGNLDDGSRSGKKRYEAEADAEAQDKTCQYKNDLKTRPPYRSIRGDGGGEGEEERDIGREVARERGKASDNVWFGGRTIWRALVPFIDPSAVLITQDTVQDDMGDQIRRAVLELCVEKGLPACIGPKAYKEAISFIDTANVAIHPSHPQWAYVSRLLSFFFRARIIVEGHEGESGDPVMGVGADRPTIDLRCTQRRQWYYKINVANSN